MVEQSGFTVHQIKGDKTICLDGSPIASTMEGTNMMGAYVKDGIFYYDGIPLMKSDNNAEIQGVTKTFGDIDLNTKERKCVNITVENYNKLLANELVTGYRPYNKHDVYNIVADVEEAPVVFYTEEEEGYRFGNILWKEKEDVIYNNVVGIDTQNPLEVNYAANIGNIDPPYVDLRYFNPIINNGDKISLQYRVTDLKDSVLNYDTIGPHKDRKNNTDLGIYRVIIKTEDGQTTEKTTYSGTIWLDTPAFNLTSDNATEENGDRRTWFTIECIDSRGVSSIRQYLDVYIKASNEENYLEIDEAYLRNHNVAIDEDGNNPISSYKNKKALSDLFAGIKNLGYNGVKFATQSPHTFYLNYHSRINGSTADNPVLGEPTYYLAEISSDNTISNYTEVSFEYVKNDEARLYRYSDNSICYIGDDVWYNKLTTEQRKERKANGEYLRTHKLRHNGLEYYKTHKLADPSIPKSLRETITDVYNGRSVYIVINPSVANTVSSDTTFAQYSNGDNLIFPNHFTIDLDGSEFKAYNSYYIDSGCIVRLYNNIDTHIISSGNKKGKFTGLYGYMNFLDAHLATAHDVVGEPSGILVIMDSLFCSIDNIEISRSLGYEGCYWSSGIQGGAGFEFNNGYYISSEGDLVQNIEGVNLEEGIGITTGVLNNKSSVEYSSSSPYIAIGRSGYAGYNCLGKRHEIFMAFYDSNNTIIDIVKTKLYHPVRIPEGTVNFKFMGYGTWITSSDPYTASNWVRKTGAGTLYGMRPKFSIGCAIKNCYIHDTRTTALSNPQGRQLLYDNITLERCATTKYLGISSGGSITPLLGDFEDSWQWAKYITIKNCTHISDSTQSSSKLLVAYSCEFMDFINNTNISLKLGGNVESGLFKDNNIPGFIMTKSRGCFHPYLEIRDNIIGRFTGSITNYESILMEIQQDTDDDNSEEDNYGIEDSEEQTQETDVDITEIDTEYNDLIEKIVPMSYSTFKLPINYGYFKLRKCLMDIDGFDYIY